MLTDQRVGFGRIAAVADRQGPQEMASEAPWKVEEMEILDLRGEPADLARQRDQKGSAQGRLAVDQSVERVAPQDVRRGRVQGDRRRRPWGAIEQRQLAEEAARADRRQDGRLGPLIGRDRDLRRSRPRR